MRLQNLGSFRSACSNFPQLALPVSLLPTYNPKSKEYRHLGRPTRHGGFPFLQSTSHENIIILDFGGQYTQLIARRVREAGVYCEILPYSVPIEEIQSRQPRGLILSGGPSSVYDDAAPRPKPGLLESAHCPVLGICYGLQLIAHGLGGEVQPSTNREYGYARLQVIDSTSRLFSGLPVEMDVWMSHGDHVTMLPDGFRMTAKTADAVNAFENPDRGIYGLQFRSGRRSCATSYLKFAAAKVIGRPRLRLRNRLNASKSGSARRDAPFADSPAASILRSRLLSFIEP